MVLMGRIRCPIGVRTVRGNDLYAAARFGDAVQLADKRHYVGNVLNNVTAYDLVKLVIGKRIGEHAQIVNNIGVSTRI
jgi:hypothetical protein